MSIEAICNTCGEYSGLRANFGRNREAEKRFHQEYRCKKCRDESKQNIIQ